LPFETIRVSFETPRFVAKRIESLALLASLRPPLILGSVLQARTGHYSQMHRYHRIQVPALRVGVERIKRAISSRGILKLVARAESTKEILVQQNLNLLQPQPFGDKRLSSFEGWASRTGFESLLPP
jgi:hypothetical protein